MSSSRRADPARARRWNGLVVIAAGVPWAGPRLVEQHIALQLTRYAPVLYVDPPKRHRGAGTTGSGVQIVAPRLAHVSPAALPGHQRPGIKAVTIAMARRSMRSAIRALGAESVRCVMGMSLNPVFGVTDERWRVLYLTDDFVAAADLIRVGRRRLERELARRQAEADIIVAVSPSLADGVRRSGREPLLIPNGCDAEAFASTDELAPPDDRPVDQPAAGLIGHLSHRIDAAFLEALADRGVPLLLIGPAPRGLSAQLAALVRRPSVHWVGERPYAELPRWLHGVGVGVVPYPDTPFNQASFPLKALEYLAAGRPVVSTDLAALRWLRAQAGELTDDDIVIARSPAEFASRTADLLAAGLEPSGIARRRAFAARHSWRRRADVLATALGLHAPAPAGGADEDPEPAAPRLVPSESGTP